jgi:putative membrane protein
MQTGLDKPRRPSAAIILTGFLKGAKELSGYLLLIVAATLFKTRRNEVQGNETQKFTWIFFSFLAGILIVVCQKAIEWFFTRYWVEGDKLILTSGMLVKHRTELPLQKIQSIQLRQNMLHRITGTCGIIMDTAGSESTEFKMEAVRANDAQDLQQWVRSRHQHILKAEKNSDLPFTERDSLIQLGFTDFAKLCLSENHLKSLALVAFFIMGKAYDISQQFGFDSKEFISDNSRNFVLSIQTGGALLFTGLMVAILFSSVRVLLKFYGYRLQQTKVAYEMSWGLFTRHRKTMPFSKVEFFTWWSNWLRQKMGLYVLRLHSLSESETEQAMQIQLPVTNRQMLGQIAHTYIAEMPADTGVEPVGIEKAYVIRKILLIGLPLALLVGTLAWFYVQWHAAWVLLWLVYYGFSKYAFYKNYKVWMTNDAIQVSRGTWGREQVVIYLNKIVSVSLHTSPFQRKHGYANLELHLPGKSWTIPYLTKEQADYWADYITFKTEQ